MLKFLIIAALILVAVNVLPAGVTFIALVVAAVWGFRKLTAPAKPAKK